MGKVRRGHNEGSYEELPDKRVAWRVRVTYPDGEQARPKGIARNMTAARAAVRAAQAAAEVGQRPASKSLTVSELVSTYITAQDTAKRWADLTLWHYQDLSARHIVPRLGHLKAAGLSPIKLRDFYGEVEAAGLGYSGQSHIRALLSGAYKHAIQHGLLKDNPTMYARPVKPRSVAIKDKAFTEDEAERFLNEALKDRWALILVFMLLTGTRPAEAIGLKWARVTHGEDKDGQRFAVCHIKETRTEYKGRGIDQDRGKTLKSERMVTLTGKGVKLLDDMRAYAATEERIHGNGPSPYVFPTSDGRPFRADTARRVITRICKRAGVRQFSPHKLRHTFSSLLLSRGYQLAVVSQHLGHANVMTTQAIYRTVYEGELSALMLDFPVKAEK